MIGVLGLKPERRAGRTVVLNVWALQPMQEPLMLRVPAVSVLKPNVMFGVMSGDVRMRFWVFSKPDVTVSISGHEADRFEVKRTTDGGAGWVCT